VSLLAVPGIGSVIPTKLIRLMATEKIQQSTIP
jgi:hypothetical protein